MEIGIIKFTNVYVIIYFYAPSLTSIRMKFCPNSALYYISDTKKRKTFHIQRPKSNWIGIKFDLELIIIYG